MDSNNIAVILKYNLSLIYMVLSFFSKQSYDKTFFDRFNSRHELRYFDAPLNEQTAKLSIGSQAVCVFVNDKITEGIISN